jgi:hypothetical protein
MFAYQFLGLQHVAEKNGWTKFVSMQNYYNLLYREEEREVLPACKEGGVGYLAQLCRHTNISESSLGLPSRGASWQDLMARFPSAVRPMGS